MRFIFFLVICGCANQNSLNSILNKKEAGKDKPQIFSYTDASGSYVQRRDSLLSGNKYVSRIKLLSSKDSTELESSVVVSRLGRLKNSKSRFDNALLPEISQFKVWFKKEEYFSQLKINKNDRTLTVIAKSPEKKYNFTNKYKLPKARYFCFFSQIPECIKLQGLLVEAAKRNVEIFVIWDNFPYYNEQYEGLPKEPYTKAVLSVSSHNKNEVRYDLDLGNQIIFYHFNKELKFIKMIWVSQGISSINTSKGL